MRQEEFEFVKRYQTAVEVSAIVDALEHKKTPEEVRAWFKDIPVELIQNGKTVKLRWLNTYSG